MSGDDNDITWASCHLKSLAIWQVVQQLVPANNKETREALKILHYWLFVRGIHQSLVDSPHKGPIMQKAFPCHDVIMNLTATALGVAKGQHTGHCLLGRHGNSHNASTAMTSKTSATIWNHNSSHSYVASIWLPPFRMTTRLNSNSDISNVDGDWNTRGSGRQPN